jgi:hypothetical protein
LDRVRLLQDLATTQEPFLRAVFQFILSAGSTICLLLLLGMIFVEMITASQPVRITHEYRLGGAKWVEGTFQMDLARGGIWFLHLQKRLPISPAGLRLPDPMGWSVTRPDAQWIDRLTPGQTGAAHLGFLTHLRHSERSEIATDHGAGSPSLIDPATGRRREGMVVEEERITRIPMWPIFLVLLTPVAMRLGLLLRAHRKRMAQGDAPSLVLMGWRYVFAVVAGGFACLLIFALWQWPRTHWAGAGLTWTSNWFSPGGYRVSPDTLHRAWVLSPQGWEFSRTYFIYGPPEVPGNASDRMMLDLSDSALALPAPLPASQVLGFVVIHSDIPGNASLRMPSPRQIVWKILIPHWAVVLLLGIVPAIWLYVRLRPLSVQARRLQEGRCIQCGYDLCASPERCPECGRRLEKRNWNEAAGWTTS